MYKRQRYHTTNSLLFLLIFLGLFTNPSPSPGNPVRVRDHVWDEILTDRQACEIRTNGIAIECGAGEVILHAYKNTHHRHLLQQRLKQKCFVAVRGGLEARGALSCHQTAPPHESKFNLSSIIYTDTWHTQYRNCLLYTSVHFSPVMTLTWL